MSWERVSIGDLCEITSSKRIFFSEYVESGVPFYRSKEIIEKTQGQDISEPLYISQEKYDEIKSRFGVPQAGDMLLTSVGTIGTAYIVKEDDYFYFKDGNLTWFRDFNKTLLSKYLFYWITSSEGYSVLNNSTIGSSQKALTISALRGIKIPLPSIAEQERIVQTLSAYDDLIENNQKQIKLLEEAAQRLYKEWFVDLRFPGYEDVKVVDGVPEGWKKASAESFFKITIGKTPPRGESQWFTTDGNGIPWVSISDMGESSAFIYETSEGLTREAIERHNVKIVPAGTVLLSFKLTVGRVAISTTDMCTNEAIAHFKMADANYREYVYCYLKNYHFDSLGSTSSISKAVNSKIIKAMPFVIPNYELVVGFSKMVAPIFNQIKNKQKSCVELKQARDRLLPKLMSGELEV